MDAEINVNPEKTARVFVDVSFTIAQRIKMRIAMLSAARGVHVNRKTYLEELIEKDLAQVSGASLREVSRADKRRK